MFFIARYKTARRLLRLSKVACIEAKASRLRRAHRAVRAERHQQRCRTHRGQGARAARAVETTTALKCGCRSTPPAVLTQRWIFSITRCCCCRRTKPPRPNRVSATPALRALIAAEHSAAKHRKGRSVRIDFAAPMTGETERQLEQLITINW